MSLCAQKAYICFIRIPNEWTDFKKFGISIANTGNPRRLCQSSEIFFYFPTKNAKIQGSCKLIEIKEEIYKICRKLWKQQIFNYNCLKHSFKVNIYFEYQTSKCSAWRVPFTWNCSNLLCMKQWYGVGLCCNVKVTAKCSYQWCATSGATTQGRSLAKKIMLPWDGVIASRVQTPKTVIWTTLASYNR